MRWTLTILYGKYAKAFYYLIIKNNTIFMRFNITIFATRTPTVSFSSVSIMT